MFPIMKPHMKLDVYLAKQKLSLARFAKLAGLSAATVFRARDSVVLPSIRTMQKIEAATDGQVTRFDLIAAMAQVSPNEENNS